jgi:hypothetical protein
MVEIGGKGESEATILACKGERLKTDIEHPDHQNVHGIT